MTTKHTIMLLCGAVQFTCVFTESMHAVEQASIEPMKPNIILIFVDDLGWGDLRCYGNMDVQTPRLDRMASEGMLFEQFYVNASLCSPSRASVITGRFPASLGIHYWMRPEHNERFGMPDYLSLELPTIPRELQKAGYRTAHFGKWHLGESREAPISAYGYDEVDLILQGFEPSATNGEYNSPHGTERLLGRTISFIKAGRTDGKPFFINLWPRDVHAPLLGTPQMMEKYKGLMVLGRNTAMQHYYASVTEMDMQIGRLLDYIDSVPGLAENTLIVFSSDNGPEDIYIKHAGFAGVGLPGPFRGRKRSLYEGGVRVPFIARWKGEIPAGVVDRTSVISAVDLMPTFLKLAGAAPVECDGEDITGTLLHRNTHVRHKPLVWEWRFDGVGPCINHSPMLAIRDGDWKLLFNPDGSRTELYNIPEQPMEVNSVADRFPEVVERLRTLALAWQKTLPAGKMTPRPGSNAYPNFRDMYLRTEEQIQKTLAPVKIQVALPEKNWIND